MTAGLRKGAAVICLDAMVLLCVQLRSEENDIEQECAQKQLLAQRQPHIEVLSGAWNMLHALAYSSARCRLHCWDAQAMDISQ